MTSNKIIRQTKEDYNSIPKIEVQDAYIKEIIIEKNIVTRGDLKGNPPIYSIKIKIIDSIGGRHEVTSIGGFCKDKIEVKI